MERMEAVSSGRVQMVMYRDFAVRKARGLGLVGEVRNQTDGTVHIIAEGERAMLERLITKLKQGPLLARVDDVSTTFVPATNSFSRFTIRYD